MNEQLGNIHRRIEHLILIAGYLKEDLEKFMGSADEPKYRDSITGEFVTAEYAEQHPDTTQKET